MSAAASDPLVYIVDDDPLVSRALSRLLAGFAVKTFGSAEEFLTRDPHDGACCLVLDHRMPGMTGLELMARLGSETAAMPVVFLTGHADVDTSVAAMKLGAFDFLMKPVVLSRLLEVVTQALDHSRQIRDQNRGRQRIAERFARLTTREREVCRLVARGLLNKQIAAELGVSESTVKIHRARLLHKLEVGSAAELAQLMQGVSET